MLSRIPITKICSLFAVVFALLAFVPFGVRTCTLDVSQVRPIPEAGIELTDVKREDAWCSGAIGVAGGLPEHATNLHSWGSYFQGVTYTGEFYSRWYKADCRPASMVSGFPTLEGNRLEVEVRLADGSVRTIPFNGSDPQQGWRQWKFNLPNSAIAFRLHAIDGLTSPSGWLGISEPYDASSWHTISWTMVAMTFGTAALAFVMILGPGVIWCTARGVCWAHVLWVGPLLLLVGSLSCWALGGIVPVTVLGTGWAAFTVLVVTVLGWRFRVWRKWNLTETMCLSLIVLAVLGTAGKAAYYGGQEGELYRGSVSRSFEVGGRSDSRIPFIMVQLVYRHLGPYDPISNGYFSPYNFSSRGPIAGLICAPVVIAIGGKPPLVSPDQPWVPFDEQGFAAYRITMMVLAALSLVSVMCLLRKLGDERLAIVGLSLVSLAPFLWHEMYFTWPKMITATWVLGAFYLCLEKRPVWAGLALGAAYLTHPLALLSAPVLGFWWLAQMKTPWLKRCLQAGLYAIAVGVVIASWRWVNRGHYTQDDFLRILLQADIVYPATIQQWLVSRWNSCADTLIPFYVWFVNAGHPSFSSLWLQSDRVVQFFLQYWMSWPFAAGLITWSLTLPTFCRCVGRHRSVFLLFLGLPFSFFAVYWGGDITGLMSVGGHVLFLSYWVFLVWAGGAASLTFAGITILLVRAFEIWALMFIPASYNPDCYPSGRWYYNDALWLTVSSLCLLAMVGLVKVALERGKSLEGQ